MLRRLCLQSCQVYRHVPCGQLVMRRGNILRHPRRQPRLVAFTQGYSSSPQGPTVRDATPREPLSPAAFEAVCEETLESLCSALDELLETAAEQPGVDVELSSGVLTVKLGEAGTYVINKQTPNQQIWLSSPVSGPKRYDLLDDGWVYRHDRLRLHELLSRELSRLLGTSVDLSSCSHTGS